MPEQSETCECTMCGFKWRRGQDGDHSCARTLKSRVAELEALHPEWMKRIQRERQEERERIIELLKHSTDFWLCVCHEGEFVPLGAKKIEEALQP